MKKKRISILLTIIFCIIAGTLYTVSYIRPWKQEVILLDDSHTAHSSVETVTDSAQISPTEEDRKTPNETEVVPMYVHICGEITEPGVYEVTNTTRLNDVVMLAGGLTKAAAAEYINLAQLVIDGQKYYIPSKEEIDENQQSLEGKLDQTTPWNVEPQMNQGWSEEEDKSNNGDGCININTASREELMTLPGVGEAKADAILSYREKIGLFETIEDITKVNGIKEGLLQKIKEKITVR